MLSPDQKPNIGYYPSTSDLQDTEENFPEHRDPFVTQMEEEEEEARRSSHGDTFDQGLYKREYEETEQRVKLEHPHLSGRDLRLEVKHQFRTRIYIPDMESMKNEAEKKEYDSTEFEILENGDVYYPQSGRTMMELYERTRKYRPELFSQKEYDTALLVARSIKEGATRVSFPSFNIGADGKESIRDVYTLVIDAGNRGHIHTVNVAEGGPQYTLGEMQGIMRGMFASDTETSPSEGVYVFTDRRAQDSVKHAEVRATDEPVHAEYAAFPAQLQEYRVPMEHIDTPLPNTADYRIPVAGRKTEHRSHLLPDTAGSAKRPASDDGHPSVRPRIRMAFDRVIEATAIPSFLRWALKGKKEKPQTPGPVKAAETRRTAGTALFVKEQPERPGKQEKRKRGRRQTRKRFPISGIPAGKESALPRKNPGETAGKRTETGGRKTESAGKKPAVGTENRGRNRRRERSAPANRNDMHPAERMRPGRRERRRRRQPGTSESVQMTKKQEKRVLNVLRAARQRLLGEPAPAGRAHEVPGRHHDKAIITSKEGDTRGSGQERPTPEKAAGGLAISLFLYFLLTEPQERKNTAGPTGTVSETTQVAEKGSEQEYSCSPWVMFSIIWYLNMLRESGFVKTGTGKTSDKRKRNRRRKHERFPKSGIVFSYAAARPRTGQNVL